MPKLFRRQFMLEKSHQFQQLSLLNCAFLSAQNLHENLQKSTENHSGKTEYTQTNYGKPLNHTFKMFHRKSDCWQGN